MFKPITDNVGTAGFGAAVRLAKIGTVDCFKKFFGPNHYIGPKSLFCLDHYR